ncbi:MAG TPA: aspartyl protease family protein [Pyrinomonadaceae bacterium]|nr:aspartyl protease family protein [Pyrinomonadaceae bacterium]
MSRAHRRAPSFVVAAARILLTCVVIVVAGQTCALAATAAAFGDKEHQRAEKALREGEFESAEKMFREMLQKNTRDIAARLGLSFALLKQRKNQEAFDAAARVITIEPTSPRAHALLGYALLASGDFQLSVEEFRTALSFKEDEALAIAGLAMVDFYENRINASLSGLRRAVFIDGDEPDYHFNLGQVAARNERYGEAADAYERFLRIAPRTDADRRARIRGLIDFLRYLGTQRNLISITGPSRSRVSFEIVNNRPIIKVRINDNKEPLRFVVDTGAGMCVVSTTAADRLGLRSVARGGNARAVGGSGSFEIVYGFLRSLEIGEARIENVPIYIRKFFNEQEKIDGYIGLSVVAKYLTSIDYGERTMTLLRDDARDKAMAAITAQSGIDIPIRITSSGFWSGEVQLDGVTKPLNFIMDTGATITVVSAALAAREDLSRHAQSTKLTVYGAAGVTDDVQMLLLPRISFGAHARPRIPAAVLDMDAINETAGFEQTGIVGGNVLRHYRVTFDFQRASVRLEPLGPQQQPAADDLQRVAAPIIANQP